jgi:prephenate dehydrogenase
MKALIVGLGLIGGSIGMALRARGWRVGYVDPAVTLDEARARGAADEQGGEADVVVLATTVDLAVRQLPSLPGLVTSVCSVMKPLRALGRADFVAGHPMTGSHERGLAHARSELLAGARWFLDERNALVEQLVSDCGAIADFVAAEEHDRAMAVISHLPQLLSTALAAHIAGDPSLLRFAGPGLQTFLRLANSDAGVWGPIVDANAEAIAPHAKAVAELVEGILRGDRRAFAEAQALMARWSAAAPGGVNPPR